jgi:predicted DNA binding CopG/RHH family protein
MGRTPDLVLWAHLEMVEAEELLKVCGIEIARKTSSVTIRIHESRW